MNWRYVSACVAGTSHIRMSLPCQDNCFVTVVTGPDGEDWLIAIASDGAGSAVRAERGAELACETGGHALSDRFSATVAVADDLNVIARETLHAIRLAIEEEAVRANTSTRDYACTLVAAVVGQRRAFYFQVGDGAIVVRRDDQLECVFWPESGEYANMTYFVTDERATEHLHVCAEEAPVEFAVMTDGLQRLALVFADRSVHNPFFAPMFSVLRKTADTDCDDLSTSLANFLANDNVNARTDDDKTLILAVRPPEVERDAAV